MVEYKIIKYCRLCKTRFVVLRQEAKKNYCDKCIIRMNKDREEQEKKEAEEEKKAK